MFPPICRGGNQYPIWQTKAMEKNRRSSRRPLPCRHQQFHHFSWPRRCRFPWNIYVWECLWSRCRSLSSPSATLVPIKLQVRQKYNRSTVYNFSKTWTVVISHIRRSCYFFLIHISISEEEIFSSPFLIFNCFPSRRCCLHNVYSHPSLWDSKDRNLDVYVTEGSSIWCQIVLHSSSCWS